MKKIILSLLVFAAFTACKKDNTVVEKVDASEKPVEKVVYKPIFVQQKPLQEVDIQEAENIVGNHDNDTVYVTNFFATWCGPCIKEIPHFKEKMSELKDKPVKFSFVDLDSKEDWDGAVKDFAMNNKLENHMVLLDGTKLTPEFFTQNFKNWDGGAIPFTIIKKGDKTDETLGSMSKEMLTEKLNSFK